MDRIHHLAVQVADIGQAVAWYRQQFACGVKYQDQSWALLGFDNIDVALVLPGQHPPHVGIPRPDAGRFGELRTHRDGSASVYIRDPGGNALEIIDSASLKEHA